MDDSDRRQPARVLVADHDPVVRQELVEQLTAMGHHVTAVESGVEAMQVCYEQRPDLVILELALPAINGYQACRLLKTEPALASVPVILLTGSERPTDRFWGLSTGADAYLVNGELAKVLPATVASLLSKRQGNAQYQDVNPSGLPVTEEMLLSRLANLLDRRLFEATAMNELAILAGSLQSYADTVSAVLARLGHLFGHRATALLLVYSEPNPSTELYVHKARPVTPPFLEALTASVADRWSEWSSRPLQELPAPVLVAEPLARRGEIPAEHLEGFHSVPIRQGERIVGVLGLGSSTPFVVEEESVGLLQRIAAQAYLVIVNARLYRQVQQLADIDSLTGLYNRRYIDNALKHEIRRSARYQSTLTVLLIDLDHFKEINDCFGHAAGDVVLQRVAGALRPVLRSTDFVGRYGGEEIIVVLSQTPPSSGVRIADRLLTTIRSMTFPEVDASVRITASIGISGWEQAPPQTEDAHEILIQEADEALYAAKRKGRDQMHLWTPEL